MENGIKKILRDKYGLFEKDIEILLEKFTKFSVPKREIILQEGQTDHYIYFVEKGIVKSTILREGREFIIFFALENDAPSQFTQPDREQTITIYFRGSRYLYFMENLP